jgi:LacI family transcriptional regulator
MTSPLIAIGIDLDWPFPHHYDVIRGILHDGEARGWRCHVVTCLETSASIDALPDGYDGIIARVSPALRHYCQEQGIPLVNVWTGAPVHDLPTVSVDYSEMGRRAADFFLKRGFRNYGFVCRAEDVGAEQVRIGMLSTLQGEGCDSQTLHIRIPYELKDWLADRQSSVEWLDELSLPVAVIASDPTVARTFVDYCQWRGLLIPDDVAVVSCRDFDLVCNGISPELTAIVPDYEAVGREAVTLLADLMEGGSVPPGQYFVDSAMRVVERRSTDVEPVDDRVVAHALRYIRDNCHQSVFVPNVASAVQMSQRQLERRFRAALDQTINQAILACRLQRAKRLLCGSDLTIRAIADAVGFGSNVRMAQVFAKRLGKSPREYRRANRVD